MPKSTKIYANFVSDIDKLFRSKNTPMDAKSSNRLKEIANFNHIKQLRDGEKSKESIQQDPTLNLWEEF